MASTFTLKRKTYTEFDYHNDIATKGFSDGYAYAIQKMYSTEFGRIAKMVTDKFAPSTAFEHGDVRRIVLRGQTKNVFGSEYNPEIIEYAKNLWSKSKGGGNVKFSSAYQKTASFIGKGYLY